MNAFNPEGWERAEHLLPGYLKKTLPRADQEWMEQWISTTRNTGGAVADALASEIEWVRHAQADLSEPSVPFNAQAGWQKLQASLQSESATTSPAGLQDHPQPTVAFFKRLKPWLVNLAAMQKNKALQWWQKPVVAALGSAMLIGQMGFLAATVKQVHQVTTETSMVTPSTGASRPVEGVVLKVVFKPKARVQEVQALLSSVQGRVIGGPGALGIWEVEVPADQLAKALQTMHKFKAVDSVTQE